MTKTEHGLNSRLDEINMNSTIAQDEIIKKAIDGDRNAMQQIVVDNEQMIYSTALKLVGNREDAECVLQETFLKVFEALPDFKGQSALSTWIYRIATNFALMKLRERKKTFNNMDQVESKVSQEALQSFNSALGNNPHKALENEELKAIMDKAVDELSPKFKSVFVLKDIEGLSLHEITEITGMTLPAVKSNLHRARRFLRDQLAGYTSRSHD